MTRKEYQLNWQKESRLKQKEKEKNIKLAIEMLQVILERNKDKQETQSIKDTKVILSLLE